MLEGFCESRLAVYPLTTEYQMLMQTSFKEVSNTSVFTFNEVVECMDFDRVKSRLIICSITGKFKTFTGGAYCLLILSFLELISN